VPIELAATLNRSAAVFAFQNPAPKAVEVLAVSRSGKASSIQALPLFATDAVLGAALLGDDRVQEWRQMVPLLEAHGLPKVDHLMGGRYVRAVVAFFDHRYGLDRSDDAPLVPDGVEDFDGWRKRQKRRA
jgi:hypothetical protein